jgi:hypothetical protein
MAWLASFIEGGPRPFPGDVFVTPPAMAAGTVHLRNLKYSASA